MCHLHLLMFLHLPLRCQSSSSNSEFVFSEYCELLNKEPFTTRSDLGRGCRGFPPPSPEMTCRFLIQLVFCKKKTMWFIGVEVEQETSAPPPKKYPGSAPATKISRCTSKLKTYYCTCLQFCFLMRDWFFLATQ